MRKGGRGREEEKRRERQGGREREGKTKRER